MKQVLIQGGRAIVQEVPAPFVSPKHILVRVEYSCISVGTEIAGVKMSGLPLYRRVLKQPDNVKRVLEMMRDQGVKHTMDRVRGKLASGSPTGYSAAGVVIEAGKEVTGFNPGDRMACAGAGIANHAEIINVPANLSVKLPDGIGTDLASTVALGAIAMQGVRRAAPTLGETFVVIGLGILGQLTVQLLRLNGCRVIGVDIDSNRIRLALENGMDHGVDPAIEDYVDRIHKLTDGYGADAAIVTAASTSSEIISEAMKACRKKGRVVLVGDVGLNLNRADFYRKELDFLISTSYGPGRYDPVYEEAGQDYPLPYVRWTENRNMEEYLRLLAEGRITLNNLYHEPYEIDRAGDAYEALKAEGKRPLLVLLKYPERKEAITHKVVIRQAALKKEQIRVAIAGAGGFAQGMHLPNLVKLRKYFELHSVMSRTGSNARAVAKQYNASYATTDYNEILNDPEVDLVIITTRHNLHGIMVIQALRSGKNVFVEKPLALTVEELNEIEGFYRNLGSEAPVLMTGFNRRFSPSIKRAHEVLAHRTTPLIINYRMNAGYIPLDHWVHTEEGGGRNIGEACHIYDLFNFLTGSEANSIHAASIFPDSKQWARNDNFVATISYKDGSVCTLTYTALGDKSYPKERMDIYADGKVISIDDYKVLSISGGHHKGWNSYTAQKGQLEELQALANCLLLGGEWPISLEQQLQATRISFEVEKQIFGKTDY